MFCLCLVVIRSDCMRTADVKPKLNLISCSLRGHLMWEVNKSTRRRCIMTNFTKLFLILTALHFKCCCSHFVSLLTAVCLIPELCTSCHLKRKKTKPQKLWNYVKDLMLFFFFFLQWLTLWWWLFATHGLGSVVCFFVFPEWKYLLRSENMPAHHLLLPSFSHRYLLSHV